MHRILPQPTYGPVVSDDEEDIQLSAPSQTLISRTAVPAYGKRVGWKPAGAEDFGMSDRTLVAVESLNCLQGTAALIQNAMLHSIH
jgi:hypothetical protein